jgi:hypothetical protein
MKLINYDKFYNYLLKKFNARINRVNRNYEVQVKYMLSDYILKKNENVPERVKTIYKYLEEKDYLKSPILTYCTRTLIVKDVAVVVKPPIVNLGKCYIIDIKLYNLNKQRKMLYKYIWTLYQMAFPFFKVIVLYSIAPNSISEQQFGLIKKQRMLELIGYINDYVKEKENELQELDFSLLRPPVFVYNENGVIVKRDL